MRKGVIIISLALFIIPFINAINLEDSTNETIYIDGGYLCQATSTESFWVNSSKEPPTYDNSINDCYRADGVSDGRHLCCPDGYDCKDDGSNWICEYSSTQYCSDITDEDDCNDASRSVARRSLEDLAGRGDDYCNAELGSYTDSDGNYCVNYRSCECKWESGSCAAVSVIDAECEGGVDPASNPDGGECRLSTSSINDMCDSDGYIYYSLIADWITTTGATRPAECVDKDVAVPCDQIAKLPGFGIVHFFICVIFLSVFYCYKKNIL